MTKGPLFNLHDVDDGRSTGVVADLNGEPTALIVVRQGETVFVYINQCPHIGAPLDFEPGRFLNLERDLIQCAMHGALFRIEDGRCVHGPCAGRGLTPVPVQIHDGRVFLA